MDKTSGCKAENSFHSLLFHSAGMQKLYIRRAFKMAPRSLTLNEVAQTINSDVLLKYDVIACKGQF